MYVKHNTERDLSYRLFVCLRLLYNLYHRLSNEITNALGQLFIFNQFKPFIIK